LYHVPPKRFVRSKRKTYEILNINITSNSNQIRDKAKALGFSALGISPVHSLLKERQALESWLAEGMNGSMAYMEKHLEMRLDPADLVEGARSIISVLLNYFPSQSQSDPEAPIVSKYAYGKDYHFVIKERLIKLLEFIQSDISPCNGRAFVDSAPILERTWAKKSGLGWIGKNSMLISRKLGSYVFIGELIIDLELDYNSATETDHCGTCTRCIDACPTGAIVSPHTIDARKCISYLTIENKEEISADLREKLNNRIFGCDICQDVCPWNKKLVETDLPEFKPVPGLLEMKKSEWINLDKGTYNKMFKRTAFERAGYKKLMQNIRDLSQNYLETHL